MDENTCTISSRERERERGVYALVGVYLCINTGSVYEDVGARQKKTQKLAQFQKAADAALWFGEYFGLLAKKLTV